MLRNLAIDCRRPRGSLRSPAAATIAAASEADIIIIIGRGPLSLLQIFRSVVDDPVAPSARPAPAPSPRRPIVRALRLIEFTRTRLAFEIARTDHKYVEVTYDLDAKQFVEVQRIVHIVFGVQG